MQYRASAVAALAAALLIGCASGGGSPPASPEPQRQPPQPIWNVKTAEYVDAWLHGFALLTSDTARVPLYERGYRDRMLQLRRQRNITTALDANRQTLSQGFVQNPGLISGQFAVYAFSSFDQLSRTVRLFVQNEGSPRTVSDPATQELFRWLGNYFRTVADREWLRLFMTSLEDEQTRFYNSYWNATQGDRAPVRRAIDSLWSGTYRAKFQRFLRNSRLVEGTIIPSLPIGGEGRTITDPDIGTGVTVPLPSTADSAVAAIFVFAHEVVASVAEHALSDNLTPAEQRTGAVDRFMPIAQVRGGALLLAKIAPELVQDYQRYYLRTAGLAVPGGDPATAFAAAFSLPDAIREGITRQIEAILGGI